MNTKVFEYIVAIAEERSVSRAAERYYLSQADMSRHLKTVEKKLGTALFTRKADGVRLTEAGAIFISDARAILHMEQELEQSFAALRRQKRHLLRLMVDQLFQNLFFRNVQPLFQAAFPYIQLDVQPCNFLQARRGLLEGGADLAIFDSTAPTSPDMEYTVFSQQDIKIVFSPDYPGPADASGLKAALEEKNYFLILYPPGTTARYMQEQALANAQITPSRILEGGVQNSLSHLSIGSTCALIPEVFCSEEKSRLIIGDTFYRTYSVIAHPRSALLGSEAQELMRLVIQNLVR